MDYTTSRRGKMIVVAFLQILFLFQAVPVVAGELCPYDYSPSDILSYTNTRYCEDGCCGTKYSDYSDVCCDVINVGVVAGSVVGGLAGLAIFIAIIVCCCVAANRSSRGPGVIIQPMNSNPQSIVLNSTSVSHGQSTNPGHPYGHAAYPYGLPPPGYAPYDNVPQPRADPAYPPPSASKY